MSRAPGKGYARLALRNLYRFDWAMARLFCRGLSLRVRIEKILSSKEDETLLYFAYGANMLPARLVSIDPNVKLVGAAQLENYRLVFSVPTEGLGQGYATISPEQGSLVWGALYRISTVALKQLDILERLPFNIYQHENLKVLSDGEQYKNVIGYRACSEQSGLVPSSDYLNRLISASESLGFPEVYIQSLKASTHRNNFPIDNEYFYFRWLASMSHGSEAGI